MLTSGQQKLNEILKDGKVNSYTSSPRYWQAGVKARQKGFERISPYYNKATASYFFYCGYDGVKFEDALSTMQDKMRELQKKENERSEIPDCVDNETKAIISSEIIIPGIGEKL